MKTQSGGEHCETHLEDGSLDVGTLSPSPWDLTLCRQNGCFARSGEFRWRGVRQEPLNASRPLAHFQRPRMAGFQVFTEADGDIEASRDFGARIRRSDSTLRISDRALLRAVKSFTLKDSRIPVGRCYFDGYTSRGSIALDINGLSQAARQRRVHAFRLETGLSAFDGKRFLRSHCGGITTTQN